MKKKLSIIIIAIFGIVLDQISKLYIASNLTLYKKNPIINNFFNVTYVQNKGAAWGILDGNTVFLVLITLIALFIIIRFIFKEENLTKLDILSYGLLLGGITGNFIDRILRGFVIDFLDFYIFGYDFPVFNIADIMIVISVIIMVVSYLRGDINENKS
ncbi:MAG: signal peptidase II [Bacilli bacterium]